MLNGMEMKEAIGTGAFGSVYRGIKNNTNYAVKKVSKALLLTDQKKMYFNNEIYLLKQLNHKNIVQYIDKKETFSCYYLILEYCNGGTLLEVLNAYMKKYDKPLPEEIVRYLTRQILEGLVYLHKENIIHRDIKAENILLSFDTKEDKDNISLLKSTVKIIDFGFARYLQKNELASSIIGTPLCMDPCILSAMNNDKVVYNEKCDIWSLGVLIYQLLIGVPPFQGNSVNELYDNVTKFKCNIPTDIKLSNECVCFVNKLLTIDECKRPSGADLFEEPFIIGQNANRNRLSLKSNHSKEAKNCFHDYWEEIEFSAQTTRDQSLSQRAFGKDSESAEIENVLYDTSVNKEKAKQNLTVRHANTINNAKENKQRKDHCKRSSTPSQLEEYSKSTGVHSFLLAIKSFKTPIKSLNNNIVKGL